MDGRELSRTIRIHIAGKVELLEAEFSEEEIEFLKRHNISIEIVTSDMNYYLPILELDLESIKRERLNSSEDVSLFFRASPGHTSAHTALEREAAQQSYSLVKPVTHIELIVVQDGTEYAISYLPKAIQGIVSIPAVNNDHITAAVLIRPDGKLIPLPVKSMVSGKESISVTSRWYGNIAFVSVDKDFKDMAGHWAEKSVKRLASMLILNRREEELFVPDVHVNRAEFVAVLARGLGLWTDNSIDGFIISSEKTPSSKVEL